MKSTKYTLIIILILSLMEIFRFQAIHASRNLAQRIRACNQPSLPPAPTAADTLRSETASDPNMASAESTSTVAGSKRRVFYAIFAGRWWFMAIQLK
jgi:hypothetical protein